jgi:23S rRNA (guanosine2251-2'-O)-methyltransferase
MSRNSKKNGDGCKPRRIYGLHPVQEHLRAVPHLIEAVYLSSALQDSDIERLAHQATISIYYESTAFFDRFAQGGVHQGVAARLRPFFYTSLSNVVDGDADCLLILDGILDPRNLGALLRTAEAAGVGGVILPERQSAPVSPIVEKTAAGATAYLPICRVENLARSLQVAQQAGYWLVGLTPDTEQTVYDLPLLPKIAFILGGEGKGIRSLTRQKCDCLVAIPMLGKIKSLNISVAGAVALYEWVRRKRIHLVRSS